MRPLRVLHPITRLIIGGAQENTMLTAERLAQAYNGRYEAAVVSGPQTGPEGSLIEEVRRRGVPLTIMPELRREIAPANDWLAFRQLTRLMREGRFDIVHTHSSKAGVLGRLAARRAKVPVIVHTVHGWSFHDQMSPIVKQVYVLLEKLGAAQSQAMIVVSPQDIEKGLAEDIGRREDYAVIRSGIELERFGHPQVPPAEMRRQLGIPADALVVGSVTRLSEQKAPLDLIAALVLLRKLGVEFWSVIVGDGLLRGAVETAVREAGLADRVILTGLRRDVPELLATFDVFALSSLWEGLPRVLPQAMATGLPIVTTGADGSSEAVSDGENGFVVPRREPAVMAERLALLLGDAQLRRRLGANGRSRAETFGMVKMVDDIDQLYQRLWAQHARSRGG